MSTFNTISALAVFLLLPIPAVSAESPGLGKPLSAAEVATLDFTVLPDGEGLPEGSGDAAQGEQVYAMHCQACHGDKGVDGVNDRLAGGRGSIDGATPGEAPRKTIGSYWPYATTVFDYVRRAMPLPTPGSLSDDELYAVTAYLLFINEIVARDFIVNARTLPEVVMPNRQNFVWAVTR